jgi:coenzyme F420 hydrogenase subunit beta
MSAEKPNWDELFQEVVTSGLCTGCAGCVIACPHDVLSYDATNGVYRPWHLDVDGSASHCTHETCTMCTRACPRFRDWEPEIDQLRFGRPREEDEVYGPGEVFLVRATDPGVHDTGQDGGFVSAVLIYALEHDLIEGALVSGLEGDGTTWVAEPRLVRTAEEVLATAGSRYTYSTNLLAYAEAVAAGLERLAVVGTGCMASAPGVMQARKAGKVARRLGLTIGLLCSKTFDDAIFDKLFDEVYGIPREAIAKMNIKGVFQIWTKDGAYHEIPLKEAHAFTREGCQFCPDFAAEHADLSAGGIGAFADWTLLIVRTAQGRDLVTRMETDGVIELRPGSDDPGALALLTKLSRVSRRRWPATAVATPRRMPPVPAAPPNS